MKNSRKRTDWEQKKADLELIKSRKKADLELIKSRIKQIRTKIDQIENRKIAENKQFWSRKTGEE